MRTSEPISPRARSERQRVLVVDDRPDNLEASRLLFERGGREVAVAHGGEEALAVARSFAPELVLCDLCLPDIDGFEVARRLRADPQLTDAYLVAVSGRDEESDRRESLAAGFDAYLVKPVDPEALSSFFT